MPSQNVEEVFRISLGGKPPYRHQKEAAEKILEGNSVVIRAPCGSGKTEACVIPFLIGRKDKLPSRLIYSLPTRALVDDVAERIIDKFKKIGETAKVAVQHGAKSDGDPFFKADLIVATIDQTVGAYCATPLNLPVYLGNIPAGAATSSMLCFDEVHTYDHRLGLQTMLVLVKRAKRLNLPSVVMSATLPDAFVNYLTDELGFALVEGKDEYVKKRRDRKVVLHWTGRGLIDEDILEKFKDNNVIVVCNTVSRAQELYSRIKDKIPTSFLLHSRFLPEDRQRKEAEMKEQFRAKKAGCLITTQVCEVGLDISCDVILTEIAPPDALIQRFGRCAREGGTGEAYVFDIEKSAPYETSIINDCRSYLIENLNDKVINWNEERYFVNALLGEHFRQIMNDEDQRRRILNSLAGAAFEGDKTEVEQNVREILNVNLTINDSPLSLGNDVLNMPWLNVDVRLVQREVDKRGVPLYLVEWKDDDERGRPCPTISLVKSVKPYKSYVIPPSHASYDEDYGLVFGKAGHNLAIHTKKDHVVTRLEYSKEPWIEHALKSLSAFEKILLEERGAIELLANILGLGHRETCGVIAFAVGLHDVGKLNKRWQEAVGADEAPLAHTPWDKKMQPPPHATISGFALQEAFQNLIEQRTMRTILALAIGHHHHTRAMQVERYCFISSWRDLVDDVEKRIEKAYGVTFSLDMVCPSSEASYLETKLPEFENEKTYTSYCIISRLVRLSDQLSFSQTNVT